MVDDDLATFLALHAGATALRWAAEDLVTARQPFLRAGLVDQSAWLVQMATQLHDLAHDISPLPTEDSQ